MINEAFYVTAWTVVSLRVSNTPDTNPLVPVRLCKDRTFYRPIIKANHGKKYHAKMSLKMIAFLPDIINSPKTAADNFLKSEYIAVCYKQGKMILKMRHIIDFAFEMPKN